MDSLTTEKDATNSDLLEQLSSLTEKKHSPEVNIDDEQLSDISIIAPNEDNIDNNPSGTGQKPIVSAGNTQRSHSIWIENIRTVLRRCHRFLGKKKRSDSLSSGYSLVITSSPPSSTIIDKTSNKTFTPRFPNTLQAL